MAPRMGDWPYKLEMFPLDKLYVDKAYQRPLTTLAKKIHGAFDPRLLAPIVVSVRKTGMNGAIVDGQTRVEAFRQLGRKEIPALVFRGTREQEAELFAKFQSERRSIRPFHRHRAAVVAGDEKAVEIAAIVKLHGYEIIDVGATVRPWGITAIRALEALYDDGYLHSTLGITSKAWAPKIELQAYGAGHPLNNEVLRGLADLLSKREKVEPDRMSQRLATTNPQELSIRAGHLRQGRGMGGKSPSYMRQVLSDLYDARAMRAVSA